MSLKDMINAKDGYLILANGKVFAGKCWGASGEAIGEIVFTTSMGGYQEMLTDPSFAGQIVTSTFPLIGDYGVNDEDFESKGSVVKGYIVREWCDQPSNFRCQDNIDNFLKKYNIIGLYGIDTRELTRIIREVGVMNGMITTKKPSIEFLESAIQKIRNYRVENVVKTVSVSAPEHFECKNAKYKVALIDYGYKYNIRRELIKRGCDVTVFPFETSAADIRRFKPDGIMLSNGPGDPAENKLSIETLKDLIKDQIPTFGICLGHQILALANGAKSVKMKYGHRGENQPVTDLSNGRTYITSQNHGFEILGDSLSAECGKVSHINANDKTCEGIVYCNAPAFTVQFHPEACSGPHDTNFLFDKFIDLMKEGK